MKIKKIDIRRSCRTAAFAVAGLLALGVNGGAADPDGQAFASPQEAARALLAAAKNGDVATALKVLGPSAKDILVTSDSVASAQAGNEFARRAQEKMLVISDPTKPGRRLLVVGDDGWPFPIPIVRTAAGWRFDAEQGKDEILLRRIGNDELTAIDVCRGYAEAQDKYFDSNRRYAQKFISSTGQRDGLYWPSTNSEDDSPISNLVAQALAEGYTNRSEPYHGYYFKILAGRGPQAPGGARSYVKDGAMTAGFAIIAWPSDYRSTGVMTFVMDRSGIVYQKDLGQETGQSARAVTAYDPDLTWRPVEGLGVSLVPRRASR
jgi:hypothetical protein